MNFEYFDIHSHLNFPQFDADREEIIADLKKNNVATLTVGTNVVTSHEAIILASQHENIFATVGLHPVDENQHEFTYADFIALARQPKVVAIGECGLDYMRMQVDSENQKMQQKRIFEDQIALAIEIDKPLMIHCREAYPDCLAILTSKKKEYGERLRGNFHFFTSPIDVARECLDLGFKISFTGPITYTDQYDEIVKYVPMDCMMTETDAPFAAPVPYRGKRNQPFYVKEVVAKIALIKGMELDVIAKKVVENAIYFFFNKN